ncbi:MAG: BrnT family toxin [Elusimicrobia bacterium]|nr:BrnT family toxin [Elusimicrobiota bacterium]
MYTENKRFEWDDYKALVNAHKHGIGFEEAASVFNDADGLIQEDPAHSLTELRQRLIGASAWGRLIVVSFTIRERLAIRIISARPANRRERTVYEQRK